MWVQQQDPDDEKSVRWVQVADDPAVAEPFFSDQVVLGVPLLPASTPPLTFIPADAPKPILILPPWFNAVAPPVTPAPAPFPVPGESWITKTLRELDNAIANGTAAFQDGEDAGRVVRQVSVPQLLGQVTQATGDVRKAALLSDLLPLVLVLVGVAMGKPALGLLAGGLLYVASQAPATAARA